MELSLAQERTDHKTIQVVSRNMILLTGTILNPRKTLRSNEVHKSIKPDFRTSNAFIKATSITKEQFGKIIKKDNKQKRQ